MQRKAENKWHGVIMAWVSWGWVSGGIPKREKVGFSLHFEVRSWPGLDVSVDFYHFFGYLWFYFYVITSHGQILWVCFWGPGIPLFISLCFLGHDYWPCGIFRCCLLKNRFGKRRLVEEYYGACQTGPRRICIWPIGFQVLNQRHYSRVSLNNDRKRLDSFLGAAPKVKWTPGEGDSIDT